MTPARGLIAGIGVALVALALTTDPVVSRERAFQGDEATYYAMALSLAYDGDLDYEQQDLARVYAEYPSGPLGIFLKRRVDGSVTFAKGYLQPLMAAPFVRLFGPRGFLVLHALLLAACIGVGASWLAREEELKPRHVATAATFVTASVVPLYARWITTEITSFALAFLGTALWFRPPFRASPRSGLARLAGTDGRELAAAFVFGLAAFVKLIPNGFLMLPLGLACLARRRIRGAVSVSLVFFATLGAFFGVNTLVTGEWNYQGGDRWTCYFRYPPDVGFAPPYCSTMTTEAKIDEAGNAVSTLETADLREWITTWPAFVFGRFGGALWYFLPAGICLASYLTRSRERWRTLLLLAIAAESAVAIYMIPFNYVGGGGAVGSRYFLGTYGLFFFLLVAPLAARTLVATWAVTGVLLGATLLAPLAVTRTPGMQSMGFPWRAFPPDLNLLLDLPTNTNPHAFGKKFPEASPRYRLYYLDQNFGRRETGCEWAASPEASEIGCFWMRGESTSEFLVQTDEPVERLRIAVLNGGRPNRVTVRVQGSAEQVRLEPASTTELVFPVGPTFVYDHKGTTGWIYRVSVTSEAGWVPALDSSSGRQGDDRFLGVFVHVDVDPMLPPENG